jgi:hypothetical protein
MPWSSDPQCRERDRKPRIPKGGLAIWASEHSSPTEIYDQLFDDYTFDLFFQTYSKALTMNHMELVFLFNRPLQVQEPDNRALWFLAHAAPVKIRSRTGRHAYS